LVLCLFFGWWCCDTLCALVVVCWIYFRDVIIFQRMEPSQVVVTEKDLENVKEEDDVKFDPNFVPTDIDDSLLWNAKTALFETNFQKAEDMLQGNVKQDTFVLLVFSSAKKKKGAQ
jgi:hypothetical protein